MGKERIYIERRNGQTAFILPYKTVYVVLGHKGRKSVYVQYDTYSRGKFLTGGGGLCSELMGLL